MKKLLCMCLLVLLCLSGTAQGQPALNEPVYLMVQGQLMEQLQVLHSGPRTCTHPSFSFEKQEAPDTIPDEPLMQEEDPTVELQPDANFTLELPNGILSLGADYKPNGETQDMTYDSDGMLPYDFARNYDDKAV